MKKIQWKAKLKKYKKKEKKKVLSKEENVGMKIKESAETKKDVTSSTQGEHAGLTVLRALVKEVGNVSSGIQREYVTSGKTLENVLEVSDAYSVIPVK